MLFILVGGIWFELLLALCKERCFGKVVEKIKPPPHIVQIVGVVLLLCDNCVPC